MPRKTANQKKAAIALKGRWKAHNQEKELLSLRASAAEAAASLEHVNAAHSPELNLSIISFVVVRRGMCKWQQASQCQMDGTCNLSAPIVDVPEDFLWLALTNKVHYFYEYFRVIEFKVEELPDGWVYRNMVVYDPARLPNWGPARITEHISTDKETGVVEFVDLDSNTHQPTGKKRYNILHRNPLRIEYSSLSADGVKTPLGPGTVIQQQVKGAFDTWQASLEQSGPLAHSPVEPKLANEQSAAKRPRAEPPAAESVLQQQARSFTSADSAARDGDATRGGNEISPPIVVEPPESLELCC